jgi:hypothetical protein
MVIQQSSIFIVDFPFNIDTKITGEEAGKPRNKAIVSENSSPKPQFKAAYDSVLKSDFATPKGNNLPVAHDEIAGISHPSHIALSKPGESQMVRLGDFDIEISGTSASLDDTVAFAQEIGLDRDLVETILLQSSTSEVVGSIAPRDRLSSPMVSDTTFENFGELEEAADAIATLISNQFRSQISPNKNSDLSPAISGSGTGVAPAEIRSLIEGYIESKSEASDNLNVEIALKKSDLAQSISAAIGAADFFQSGPLDRILSASSEVDQNLKRVVLEALNGSPSLDDVRQSLLVRAGQQNLSEISTQSPELIPEFKQQPSQVTASSAKDFLRGVSQDPVADRHFLSALNPRQTVTPNTLDVILDRGVTAGLSEGDVIRSSKIREGEINTETGGSVKNVSVLVRGAPGEINTETGGSVKGYELASGSKPAPPDSLKATVEAEASFLSTGNPASSGVTNGSEPSGPRANIDQITPPVVRGADLGASAALSGGGIKQSQQGIVGDAVKVGLKNPLMDDGGVTQKILRSTDLNSHVGSDSNRAEQRLAHNSEERSEPKPHNFVDSIKSQGTARVDFEVRSVLAKDEPEFRQVGGTEYRVTTKGPRVSGEFDQRLNPSIGANEGSSTRLSTPLDTNEVPSARVGLALDANEVSSTRPSSPSRTEEVLVQRVNIPTRSGTSETDSPKPAGSEAEKHFTASETNAKQIQRRVTQDGVPRPRELSLEEDRVGTLRGLDLGSRADLVSPNVSGPTRNSNSQSSKVAFVKTTDSLPVELTKDFLTKRELSNLGNIEHRVTPQSIDGGTTSPSLQAPLGNGFGINEPAFSAAPTINSGLNLNERSAPLDSSVLTKSSAGQSSQAVSTREMVGENLSKLIGQRMLANVEAGNYRINFNLFPRDMGMVDITMELRDGRLDAQINASNAITRDLLGDTLPRLRDALSLSGFSESNIELGNDQHRRSGHNANGENSGNGRDSDSKKLEDRADGPGNIIVEDLHLDPDTVDLWA